MLLLLSSLSKHRQEGKRLTVCLVPYATWQQSLSDMAGVWATAKGSLFLFFFNLFYLLLPWICLCLQWKCEIKSVSGPHQTRFIVWPWPQREPLWSLFVQYFRRAHCESGEHTDSYNILSPAHDRLNAARKCKMGKTLRWNYFLVFCL